VLKVTFASLAIRLIFAIFLIIGFQADFVKFKMGQTHNPLMNEYF